MGTTRIKVVDLSSDQEQIKTSRKHAEKLAGVEKIKKEPKPKPEHSAKSESLPNQNIGVSDEQKVKSDSSETLTERSSESSVISESSEFSEPKKAPQPPKQPQRIAHRRHMGRKYVEAKTKIEAGKAYSPKEAIELLSKVSITKFDPTVEVHLNVTDKNMRGSVKLPNPIKSKVKEEKILFFSDQSPETSNQKLIIGDEKTIDQIAEGRLKAGRDFTKVYSQAKFMPALAKIAKVLGPAGLMPNPKNKTIVEKLTDDIFAKSDDGFEYRTDPISPIIHTQIGKLSTKSDALEENLKALITSIGPTKIKKVTIKSTMSPAIRIEVGSPSA